MFQTSSLKILFSSTDLLFPVYGVQQGYTGAILATGLRQQRPSAC